MPADNQNGTFKQQQQQKIIMKIEEPVPKLSVEINNIYTKELYNLIFLKSIKMIIPLMGALFNRNKIMLCVITSYKKRALRSFRTKNKNPVFFVRLISHKQRGSNKDLVNTCLHS